MMYVKVEKKLNEKVVSHATKTVYSPKELHAFLVQMEYHQTEGDSNFHFDVFNERVYTVDLGTTPEFDESELN